MSDTLPILVVSWLGTYALHSTLILGGVWLFERCRRESSPSLREALWRTGMLAAIVTASLQTSGIVRPKLGQLEITVDSSISNQATSEEWRPSRPQFLADPPRGVDTGRALRNQPSVSPESGSVPPSSVDQSGPSAPTPLADVSFLELLLAGWLAGAALLLGRTLSMARSLRRELAGRTPITRGPVVDRMQALALSARLERLPRLSSSGTISGPLTLPNGEICIPDWVHRKLSEVRFDAMLAHEIAHVVRRDALWLIVGVVIQALFFFQPLNTLARRRLLLLAEISADDWAATQTGDGRALAECLAEFAERGARQSAPAFAAPMAHSESSLVQRIRRLLNGTIEKGALPMKARLLIALGAVLLTTMIPGLVARSQEQAGEPRETTAEDQGAAPPFVEAFENAESPELPEIPPEPSAPPEPAAPADPLQPFGSTVNVQTRDGCRSVLFFLGRCENGLGIRADGDIELAPDGSGIESISDGGYLEVSLTRDGTLHRVRFEGHDGGIDSELWIDGEARPWDEEAERFVLDLMPILFRATGLSAERRVAWLLDNGGHERLLDEIELIRSDAVQQLYTVLYGRTGSIPARYFERLTRLARDRIGSDAHLESALESLHETQRPTGKQLEALILAAISIGSDAHAEQLLATIGASLPDTDGAVTAYLDIAGTIGSDAHMREALLPVLLRDDISERRIVRIIELAGQQIGSDAHLGSLLLRFADRVGDSDELARAYTTATYSIGSDHWAQESLTRLASDAELSAEGWRMLLQAALTIGSDANCAALLLAVADDLPRDAETLAAYRAALDTIGSESHYRRVSRSLDGRAI
jgi:beta-lactamase regulating signal transducer with metallopeptidase domain